MTAANPDEQDAQDMARLANGSDAALDDLMARHSSKLFHYLIRSLQNEDEAADLAQETFVRVYQNRAKFDSRRKFTTWLYSIASNLVRDRYRWRARHPQVSLDAANEDTGGQFVDSIAGLAHTPSEGLQQEECAEAVRCAIGALPEELRVPLILAEYEDRSHAEIAEVLGCSVKAVETRVYRARKQLRQALAPLLHGGSFP
ncbi:MAG: sigma-70 family RNA polymerase sigma factor [Verrucomicrobia bacterium]|nr:sigma-70 family RNA polymerase sigma factor [Verrucomicrobiota bacterium]